jgi:SAM-dependent methyltransferase
MRPLKSIISRAKSTTKVLYYQLIAKDDESLVKKMGHRQFIGMEFEEEGCHQLQFCKEKFGVEPTTRFLDVACGSLRLGRHMIPFLNKGNYFGLEQYQYLVDAGLEHEIEKEHVEEKKPTFFVNSSFQLDGLSGINVAWSNSLFSHLTKNDIVSCLISVRNALADDGVFYATFFEGRHNRIAAMFGSHSRLGFPYPHEEMAEFGREAGFYPNSLATLDTRADKS